MFLVSVRSRLAGIRVSSAFRLFAISTVLTAGIAAPAQLAGPKRAPATHPARPAQQTVPMQSSISANRPAHGTPSGMKPLSCNCAHVAPAAVWTQATPVTSPSGRYYPTLAYDAATKQLVLFGGTDANGNTLNDTWTYDGTTWTQQSPASSPPARVTSMMAYDAASGKVVLFGGGDVIGNPLGDTWTYDGTTWTQQNPATSPSARSDASMAYDDASGQVVLFGGYDTNGIFGDTWTYDGTTWTQQNPSNSPSARFDPTMAFDPMAGLVLFGGYDNNSFVNDTWTYDGGTWTQQAPADSPSPRFQSTMAYDASTRQVVLFGGYTSDGNNGETWTYDGTTWTQQSLSSSPAPRYVSTTAYDVATGLLVLFGGSDTGGDYFGDTWNYGATAPAFSDTAVRTSSTVATATFTFTKGGSINPPVVLTQGAPNLDFTDAGTGTCTTTASGNTGGTCTVDVKFAPTAPGQRLGAIEILDTNGNVLTTEFIAANGTGPLATFTPGTLTTFAGDGSACSGSTAACGDGGLATAAGAEFNNAFATAVDGAGNMYISDVGDNRIREVSAATGLLSTVAGDGNTCPDSTQPCGDGGLATASGANLNAPSFVAVDGAGNLYIADLGDQRVRKVTAATGILSTIAGTGASCIPKSLKPKMRGVVVHDAGACGDGGPAIDATVDQPVGLAVDGAGNVYFSDNAGQRVRKVTAATGIISTVAGSGAGCPDSTTACGDGGSAIDPGTDLNYPGGIALDGAGNLYIADQGDQRIREVAAATGIITTVAGDGHNCSNALASCGDGGAATAAGASLYYPYGVAVDAAGDVYIADSDDFRVRKVTASTGTLSTVAGSGNQCVVAGNLGGAYVPGRHSLSRTRAVPPGNSPTCGDGGAATAGGAAFSALSSVALDGAGNLYIADGNDNRIRKVTATAATIGFADTTAGNTSPGQTLLVNNIGYNGPLGFYIPTQGNTNPSVGTDFTVDNGSTCPQLTDSSTFPGSLGAGASCSYVLYYQPVDPGAVAHFFTLRDDSLNVVAGVPATQSIPMTGSTGGLGLNVNNVTAPFNDSAVLLSFTIGYGGNVQPTGTPTLTVDGSAGGVGAITCQAKAGHFRCTATYDAGCSAPGDHTIAATEPANGNYAEADGTGTLTIEAGANQCLARPARKPVKPSVMKQR